MVESKSRKDNIVIIDKGMNWGSLGRMSGGPVFCWRQSGSLLQSLSALLLSIKNASDLPASGQSHQSRWDIRLVTDGPSGRISKRTVDADRMPITLSIIREIHASPSRFPQPTFFNTTN